MQDNNWTDDGEFWDEAWADMHARLDERNDRKPLVLWLVGLLLLIGLLAGTTFYLSNQAPTPPVATTVGTQQNIPARPQVQGAEGEAKFEGLKAATPTQNLNQTDLTIVSGKTGNESLQHAQIQRTRDRFSGFIDDRRSSAAATNSPTANEGQTPAPLPSHSLDLTDVEPNGAIDRDVNGQGQAYPGKNPGTDLERQENYTKEPDVPVQISTENLPGFLYSQSSLPPDISHLPSSPKVSKFSRSVNNKWFVEASGSSSLTFTDPGIGIGAGLKLPVTARLSVPLSLGYRRFSQQIQNLNLDADLVSDPLQFAPAGDLDRADFSRDVLEGLRLSKLNTVASQLVELQAGLDYRMGRRFSIATELGVAYVTSFTGPSVTNSSGADVLRYDFGDVGSNLFTSNFSVGNQNSGELIVQEVRLRRWLATAEVSVGYQLSLRLQLTLSGRQLLGAQTANSAIALRRSRASVGLRYYIR